jgi:hypothetical protein
VQPVVWIGQREIDLARHPRPEAARPIRIVRHAFARNAPSRDLLVSPDHAIFWNGTLTPAKLLLNGRTITQDAPAMVRYFHVELPCHDIIYAEGLAAESYLDTGNRAMFASAGPAMLLHPHFPIRHWSETCAPMTLGGEAVAATRRHLLARAERLGRATTEDPDLHLLADGRRLDAQPLPDGRLRLAVPKGVRALRLASRSGIARELLEGSADARRLGACIGKIEVVTPSGAFEMALDDPALGAGWHAPETGWRWTDGNASLGMKGPCLLHITLAGTLKFPSRQQTRRRAA